MINKSIIKVIVINLLLRIVPLPLVGLVLYWLTGGVDLLFYLILPLIIFFLAAFYFIILITLAGIVAKISGPLREGLFDINSKEAYKWRVHLILIDVIGWAKSIFALPTSFFAPWFKFFLKAKIGKNSMIFGHLHDPALIEIGDNTMIGSDSIISGHLIEKGKLLLKKVKIGNNCLIGGRSGIAPGVIIKDCATIGAYSIVTKNQVIGKNEVWVGVPARRIKPKSIKNKV